MSEVGGGVAATTGSLVRQRGGQNLRNSMTVWTAVTERELGR